MKTWQTIPATTSTTNHKEHMTFKKALQLSRQLMRQHRPKGLKAVIWHNEAKQIMKDSREFGIDKVFELHKDVPRETVQRIVRLSAMVDIWIE